MTYRQKAFAAGAAALVLMGGIATTFAQDGGHGGMMMGGPGARFCRSSEAMAPLMAARLEATLKPTDAQKADFEALKTAMTKAEATLKAGCPTEAERANRTPPARLAMAEKHLAAALEAMRTVRPAFDTLYAKLDDKQRDAMRWMRGPMGAAFGGGREHGEHRHGG